MPTTNTMKSNEIIKHNSNKININIKINKLFWFQQSETLSLTRKDNN